ncbi:hypothetical protein ISN44_As05g059390 [Arabidopsis suecica]|uniref:Uncharacterized protein n=1 Tax=Arabidopsis suecica TaxID=45249 RepID=A0A8T2DS50_ARASU|nr:hypothetical protein ISN44_As05g059390 [Arabidopsis suecica]
MMEPKNDGLTEAVAFWNFRLYSWLWMIGKRKRMCEIVSSWTWRVHYLLPW